MDRKKSTNMDLIITDRFYSSVGPVLIDTRWMWDSSCYETMLFRAQPDGSFDASDPVDCDRYISEEEAKEGHVAMITKWS